MRLTVRSIGLLLMALGAWGAIVPFVGPEFGYPFPAGSDSRLLGLDRDTTWQLSLLPGIAAAYGGLILLGLLGTVRFAPALGALIALVVGRVVRPRRRVLPPVDDPASGRHRLGLDGDRHERRLPRRSRPCDLGARRLRARAPRAAPGAHAGRAASPTPHPVLDHEPERTYEEEPVAPR